MCAHVHACKLTLTLGEDIRSNGSYVTGDYDPPNTGAWNPPKSQTHHVSIRRPRLIPLCNITWLLSLLINNGTKNTSAVK